MATAILAEQLDVARTEREGALALTDARRTATEIELRSGARVRVPTADETLRIKGFLTVRRNQVRDFLDVAALSERAGRSHAATGSEHPILRRYVVPTTARHAEPSGLMSSSVPTS